MRLSAPLIVALSLAFGLFASTTAPAHAAPLSAEERQQLLDEKLVRRPLDRVLDGRHYLGGISYLLVPATPEQILKALASPEALHHVLPATQRVEVLSQQERAALVELVSGSKWVNATFSVQLRWTQSGDGRSGQVEFWLEGTRPADISDVFGYIRVTPFNKTRSLVTVAALLDLGGGLLSMLFGDKIQNTLLRTPSLVERYVKALSRNQDRGGRRRVLPMSRATKPLSRAN